MTDARLSIPADVRARLRGLRLRSRGLAPTQGVGQHASRARGAGLEFAQYRSYEQGDEPRRIDWKLFARSDRYFVRESERDSPLRVWLLIDTSASMGQSDATRRDWTRLDAARMLALCIIELALQQGDAFGVARIGGGRVDATTLAGGARHRHHCAATLAQLEAKGRWPTDESFAPLWERFRAGDLVVMLGDHFDESCVGLLERLAIARREVLSIVLLTREEREFPFDGSHRFRDVESGSEIVTDAASVRDEFLKSFPRARAAQRARLSAVGVRRVEYFLDQPLHAPLQVLFDPARAQ